MKRTISVIFTCIFVVALFAAAGFSSCKKKEHSCFSQELKNAYNVIDCTNDCPGVIGCDGKKYCNACIAGSQGIAVN